MGFRMRRVKDTSLRSTRTDVVNLVFLCVLYISFILPILILVSILALI